MNISTTNSTRKLQKNYLYFKFSINFIQTSNLMLFFMILIEYIDIYIHSISSTTQLFYLNQPYKFSNDRLISNILYLSPYYYFFKLINSTNNENRSITRGEIGLIVYAFIFIIFFIVYSLLQNFNIEKLHSFSKKFSAIYINFYNYFIYRTFSILGFNLFFETILRKCITNNANHLSEYALLLVFTLFGITVIIIYIKMLTLFTVWSSFTGTANKNMNMNNYKANNLNASNMNNNIYNNEYINIFPNYPFDNYLCKKLDFILIILKLLICFNTNFLHFNNNQVSYLLQFTNVLTIGIVILFTLYLVYLMFVDEYNVFYLPLNNTALLRMVIFIFTAYSILLRMLFHDNNDIVLFIIFGILGFVFVIFFCFLNYKKHLFYKISKSSNYLGVVWFLQVNNIDKEKFIFEWIINHKIKCVNLNCEVCSELKEEKAKYIQNEFLDGNELGNNNNQIKKELLREGNSADVKNKSRNNLVGRLSRMSINLKNKGMTGLFNSTVFTNPKENISSTPNNNIGNYNFLPKGNGTIIGAEAMDLATPNHQSYFNDKINDNDNKNNTNNFSFISETLFNIQKFSLVLLSLAKRNRSKQSFSQQTRLDLLELNTLFITKKDNQFTLFLTLSNFIRKYKNHLNALLSFEYIFETIRQSNQNNITNYKILHKSENLRNDIKQYLYDFDNFVRFEMKTPENLIEISNKFEKIKQNTSTLHSLYKKYNECNYQLIILRYLYETVLHSKIKTFHHEFEINFFEDFLEFHYANDKLFLINYSFEKKNFTIIKGSKKIMAFKLKPLENLFPEYIKEKGLELFTQQLTNNDTVFIQPNANAKVNNVLNNNIFEFISKDLNREQQLGYIQSFKMKYCIYPSKDVNEILIQANYLVDHKNILIFEKSYLDVDETLFSLSYTLYKIFGLTPEMLQVLAKAGKVLYFNQLFNKSENPLQKHYTIYSFQYQKYNELLFERLQTEGLNDCINYDYTQKLQTEFKKYAKIQKELFFSIKEMFSYDNQKSKFIVYTVKEFVIKKGSSSKAGNVNFSFSGKKSKYCKGETGKFYNEFIEKKSTAEDNNYSEKENDNSQNLNELSSENDDKGFSMMLKYENQQTTGPSTLSAFSTVSASITSMNSFHSEYSMHHRKLKKEGSDKMKHKKVNQFTYLIFVFGICLMILTLLFMILEISNNNIFKKLFELFQSFKFYKRGIDSSLSSVFSNLCVYTPSTWPTNNNRTCIPYLTEYSQKAKYFYPLLKNGPDLHELIALEIEIKFEQIVNRFGSFQAEMYRLNFQSINVVEEGLTDIYALSNGENGINLIINSVTYVDFIRTYNNYMSVLINNKTYLEESFSLFNFINNYTVIQFYSEDYTLTDNQNSIYLLILNYPILQRVMIHISGIIEEEFEKYLSKINLIMNVFFIILFILHIVLCFFSLFFLNIFVQMLKYNMIPLLMKFVENTFLEFIEERIKILQQLCELYEENPMSLINKNAELEEGYKRHIKEINSNKQNKQNKLETETSSLAVSNNQILDKTVYKQNDQFVEDSNHGVRKITTKDFSNIISSYKVLIIVLFVGYAIYSILFYAFLTIAYDNLTLLVTYAKINTELDNDLYDNFNALSYLRFSNTSSMYLGQQVRNNETYDYLEQSILNLYSNIKLKDTYESVHKNLFPPMNSIVDLNCTKYQIQDSFFLQTMEHFEYEYNKFLSAICSSYPVTSYGNDNIIFKEILYLLSQLFHKYKQETYENKLETIELDVNYDLYIITLVVARIVRTYFNEQVFKQDIDHVFEYFSIMIVIYLVVNLFLEVVIFLILNFFVISRIKKLNQKLGKFISSIKF